MIKGNVGETKYFVYALDPSRRCSTWRETQMRNCNVHSDIQNQNDTPLQ